MTGDAWPVGPVATFSGVDALLHLARRQLGMDHASVSRFDGPVCRVRNVSVAHRVRTRTGLTHVRAECACDRVAPALLVPDAAQDEHLARLAQQWDLPIGSLAAVLLTTADGRPWGTLSVTAADARPDLGEDVLATLHSLGETLLDVLLAEEAQDAGPHVVDEVHDVVARGALQVVLQPLVHLQTGMVVGHEALTRFPGSDKPTSAWFHDATVGGVGPVLERATVERALELVPHVKGRLSINLSSETLLQPTFLAWAERLPWQRLILEITEQQPVEDYDRLGEVLTHLRASGALVAVDDTGSGYSSLRHALAVEPDLVKLDLSLVQSVHSDDARQALVSAVCSFAERIGARVVAEGIETPEDLACLVSLGVQLGQGYLLGRPSVLATGAAS
ncbi:EAL domain-containing protein [Aeromicrobium sp. IC_218]|uniref:EAL domain-containing protein n=1 Tax=Aeromicrobium sp. IC_218 TaxID=2545468 RepID=UPI0013F4A7F8|nr:EAL domain-containing protein [Aeromicrobium sp. IC_218]